MKTLSIVSQLAPKSHPNLDMQGAVAMTALVMPNRGDEFYLCNPMNEIIEARDSREPFVAHQVIGMHPKRVIIEPGTIARIREV